MTEVARSWQQSGFKFRATGIAIDEDRLLVHTVGPSIRWWALPGGGPSFQELTATTLEREMEEELGTNVEVGRLLFVVERMFTTGNGDPAHHIEFAYAMTITDASIRRRRAPWAGPTPEDYGELLFHWQPLAALGHQVPFYPAFMADRLRRPLPTVTEHIAVTE